MNPQEYTITEVLSTGKPWKNGISYYDIIVDSRPKPLSIGKKQPPQVGWTIYGIVTEEPGQLADKFKAVQRDEQAPTVFQTSTSTTGAGVTYSDPRQESIERQCALKAAVELTKDYRDQPDAILELANIFVAWIKDGTMPGVERQEGDDTPAKEELRKTVEALKGGDPEMDDKLVKQTGDEDYDEPGLTDDDYQG